MVFSTTINAPDLEVIAAVASTLVILALGVPLFLLSRRLSKQRRMLQFEQERWRLLMKANQVGLFDLDVLRDSVFYSPQWKAILGYGPDEMVSKTEEWHVRLHPDDERSVLEATEQYLKKGAGTLELEYRLRHRDGSWRWIVARSQAVWDSSGRAIRLVGSHSDITERKRVIEALHASEARFRAFMDHSPCLSFIKDADGRMEYTNPKFEQTWHLKPGEWIGKYRDELWPADSVERFRELDETALRTGVPQESIEELRTPHGLRSFLTTVFAYPKATGEKAVGGVTMDITERVQGDKALRASEIRYRQLFERNPLPCFMYSLDDFQVLDVNQATVKHYGWSREELLGMKFTAFACSAQDERLQAELLEHSQQDRGIQSVRHRRKDGSEIWVELTGYEIDVPGISAMLAMAQDISVRVAAESEVKRTQEQLETLVAQRTWELCDSEAKWRGLVEALPQFVWSTGADGEVDYLSNQWEEYTGIPMAELLGSGWLRTLHPADLERVQQHRFAARSANQMYDMEYRIRGKDGMYRWFVARGRPIRAAENGPVHWLGTSTDIEDQKRSEERLETAVRERTIDLAEARDRAEIAAKAKSAFLAAMSHEIRTPMNAVIGMTELLLSMPLKSEQRCYLDTIRSSGQALMGILNDVLDFSKIEAGKMELDSVEFDLQTVLEESIELVHTAAVAKQLLISLDVDDTLPLTVVGDPGRLRQILLNLLSNAVKFTREGSVQVCVSRAALQDQVLTLRFSVRDTGIGMSMEQQASIFQAFTQADRSTTRRFGGTGLGLSIAKRLVELMGGSIGVCSQPGEGTTFWFNICVTRGTEFEHIAVRNQRVLLVDRNLQSCTRVRQYLERAGMLVAENVTEAATQGMSVALALVDSMSMRDTALLERLKTKKHPVLVMGAEADWNDALAFPAQMIHSYVPKPVRFVPLVRAMQAALFGGPKTQTTRSSHIKVGTEFADTQVLLVEDNLVNQTIAKLLLERLGCQVDIARNGIEGCRAVESKSYDAVFMDCQMPEMDGFEATRFIRSGETGRSRTPIIALTAGVLKEERDQCYASGMDDFLSKPISQEALRTALVKWVSSAKAYSK